ncbi:MAG: hypothetical protein Q4C75_08105, partial [Bergeyella zoohelcum]|nr:hypothetical protein [Bergeyella zoohelcum]
MKKYLYTLCIAISIVSCKKENTTSLGTEQPQKHIADSMAVSISSQDHISAKIQPQPETKNENEVVFKQNDMPIITFDTQSQTG